MGRVEPSCHGFVHDANIRVRGTKVPELFFASTAKPFVDGCTIQDWNAQSGPKVMPDEVCDEIKLWFSIPVGGITSYEQAETSRRGRNHILEEVSSFIDQLDQRA